MKSLLSVQRVIALFFGVPLFFLALAVIVNAFSPEVPASPQSNPTYTTFEAKNALDAAEVGDRVVPRTLTIVCGNETDAFNVLYAGKVAMSEYHRLGGISAWQAAKTEQAAREAALRDAYSCTVVKLYSGEPLLVETKRIDGKPGDLFPTVTYGLRQNDNLFIVKVEQNDISPFEPVKRKKVVSGQSNNTAASQSSELKSAGYGVTFKHPVVACIDPDKRTMCRSLDPNIDWAVWNVPKARMPDAAKALPDGMYAFCISGTLMTRTPTTCEWAIVRPGDDVLAYPKI
jgi:hypothetical protein